MKSFILTLLVFSAAITSFSQNKLISFFNALPEENRNGLEIKKVAGKWIAHSHETEQNLGVKLNTAGTYLQIIDNGTGGGTTTFQLKIFKDNKGAEFIANNKSWTDGVMGEGGFSFTYVKTGADATMAVFPDMAESEFLKDGESKEGFEEYFTKEYAIGNIPEVGNTIELMQGYAGINAACINEDKKGCEQKKKLKAKLILKWDKQSDMFMPAN
jgi:hypothetical protein